ncbi:hypothetical protein Zmor_004324 [Zophobas morio]|uniref:RNA helicase n=1 Tax=Zophobas morio TaxID=2755281 RepID=A0AA38HKX9_9CUCU|nr:hypothetical protein Zmor_004324 [Zophobas morio]
MGIFRFASRVSFVNWRASERFPINPLLKSSLRKESSNPAVLRKNGIERLFPIQSACYDYIYNFKDVIARARTGTGKTLSFALPMVERLKSDGFRAASTPIALILSPTRELALQISKEFSKIDPNLRISCLYGGVSYTNQLNQLKRSPHFIVATPGRLCDLMNKDCLNFKNIKYFVLDEADRMLDIGFEKDLNLIIQTVKEVNPSVQISLFSATIPSWVRSTVGRFMDKDYALVDLVGDADPQTSETLVHKALVCQPDLYPLAIQRLIKFLGASRVIVFTETRVEASNLAMKLPNAAALHGDVSQATRETRLRRFKEGHLTCLVATDVAARGIDVPDIDLVLQVGPPRDDETYVHRSGLCVTLFEDVNDIRRIEEHIKQKISIIALPCSTAALESTVNTVNKKLGALSTTAYKNLLEHASELLKKYEAQQVPFKFMPTSLKRSARLFLLQAVAMLYALSLQANPDARCMSALTGKEGWQTWQTPVNHDGCFQVLRKHGMFTELYRTTKGGVVFDLPVSQEADVKAAFDAEQQEVALVTGDLPEVLNFPTNLVPSRKRFGQQRDGFLNACYKEQSWFGKFPPHENGYNSAASVTAYFDNRRVPVNQPLLGRSRLKARQVHLYAATIPSAVFLEGLVVKVPRQKLRMAQWAGLTKDLRPLGCYFCSTIAPNACTLAEDATYFRMLFSTNIKPLHRATRFHLTMQGQWLRELPSTTLTAHYCGCKKRSCSSGTILWYCSAADAQATLENVF